MNSIINSIKKNLPKFQGRATRKEFWRCTLASFIIIPGVLLLAGVLGMLFIAFGPEVSSISNFFMNHSPFSNPLIATFIGIGIIFIAVIGCRIAGIIICFATISVTIRRLHDLNKSGWWALLTLIPVAGWIWWIVLGCRKGNKEANQYGDAPSLLEEARH